MIHSIECLRLGIYKTQEYCCILFIVIIQDLTQSKNTHISAMFMFKPKLVVSSEDVPLQSRHQNYIHYFRQYAG